MGLIDHIAKRFLEEATIIGKQRLSPAAIKVTIQAENIKTADFYPGYFIRLGVGFDNSEVSLKDKVRSYTVWDLNPITGTIELAIATHSNGIGASWAEHCKVGDKVFFAWKKGKFLQDNSADSYLMIGDLSALSHLYVISRNLPPEKQKESIVYSQDINELFADFDGEYGLDLYQMAQNPLHEISQIIEEVIPKMKGTKMVYIAGDSRLCVALNQYFRTHLNWNTKNIKIKPFWNPEKKGLE